MQSHLRRKDSSCCLFVNLFSFVMTHLSNKPEAPTAIELPNIWFQCKVQNLSFTKAAGDQVHKEL